MKNIFIFLILISVHSIIGQDCEFVTTESGLKYFITQRGDGVKIDSGSVVIQHYILWLSNGERLESSRDLNEPFGAVFPSEGIIKGTNEAISLMNVGDRGIFLMPYYLAYGEEGDSEIPPKETLTFDIEILEVVEKSLEKELNKILTHNYDLDSLLKVEQTINKFHELKDGGFQDIWIDQYALNTIGYLLLRDGYLEEAVEIFELNVKEYPDSSNPYDSLGEAYMKSGKIELAIINYRKSLELNPKNSNAVKMLENLERQ
tara:strand:+ start:1377 stop:2156 length:780 start_codon:yes stop_codon:yes gene_type:complete